MTLRPLPDPVEVVIPLHGEDVSVERRKVERDVQVHVRTVNREHLVDEALSREEIEIERVTIGRPIDAIPPTREEGDTTVISVVEETVVVERRLILKEEIRLRRVRTTEKYRETVTLREQQAVIDRLEPGAPKRNPNPELAPIPTPQEIRKDDYER
jgi:stress response protein YsnF